MGVWGCCAREGTVSLLPKTPGKRETMSPGCCARGLGVLRERGGCHPTPQSLQVGGTGDLRPPLLSAAFPSPGQEEPQMESLSGAYQSRIDDS